MDKYYKWFKKNMKYIAVALGISICIVINITFSHRNLNNTPKKVEYTEFMQMVKDNKVSDVNIDLDESTFSFTDNSEVKYTTDNPKDKDFKKLLLENGVNVTEYEKSKALDIFSKLLNLSFTLILLLAMVNLLKNMGGSKKVSEPISQVPDITFDKIAGNKEVKEEVTVLVDFLKNPKKYTDKGAKMPKGIILYGPPGTGKTLTAKAIAGEAKVPFFSISGSDFVELYVGVGAKRVRELFNEARKKSPCIIFIDEFDAIGGKRGVNNHPENDQTINALLTEMDGFKGTEGILVIVATNRLDSLDNALIRAGRFDRHVMIPLPQTPNERLELLELYSKNKKIANDVSLTELSKRTYSFSGSDIETLLNEATIISISEGKDEVDKNCIDKAMYQKLLKGHQRKNIDRQDDEIKLVAWHEAGHALVTKLLTDYDIPNVTIISSTSGAGGVTFTTPTKIGLLSKKDLYNDIKIRYAGNVAELLLLGNGNSVTTGAYSDYQQATESIKNIIVSYGMNKKIGRLNLDILGVDNEVILEEATILSNTLYDETLTLLNKNIGLLEKIANALIEKETLSERELNEIINSFSENNTDNVVDITTIEKK